MALLDIQPPHASLPDRPHELQRRDAGHVIRQGVHEEIDLHPADLGCVIVDQFDIGVDLGLRMHERILVFSGLDILLELPH